jgi:hypothetical protein
MSYLAQYAEAPKAAASQDASPERIHELARTLTTRLDTALKEIQAINMQTKLLSFNAQIEARQAVWWGLRSTCGFGDDTPFDHHHFGIRAFARMNAWPHPQLQDISASLASQPCAFEAPVFPSLRR